MREPVRAYERIHLKQSNDESTLHIARAWTECSASDHAKGHFLDRARFIHRVHVPEDQNLSLARRILSLARRSHRPSDTRMIAGVFSKDALQLRAAPAPIRR